MMVSVNTRYTGEGVQEEVISGMTAYAIRLAQDDAMPNGHDFLFVDAMPERVTLFLRKSTLCAETLEDAWSGYRAMLCEQLGRPPDDWMRLLAATG